MPDDRIIQGFLNSLEERQIPLLASSIHVGVW